MFFNIHQVTREAVCLGQERDSSGFTSMLTWPEAGQLWVIIVEMLMLRRLVGGGGGAESLGEQLLHVL